MKQRYETPSFTTLGTVHSMTLQEFNKTGHTADVYTGTGPVTIVGSIVPI